MFRCVWCQNFFHDSEKAHPRPITQNGIVGYVCRECTNGKSSTVWHKAQIRAALIAGGLVFVDNEPETDKDSL